MFLNKREIKELTGRKTRRTQKQVLDAMGITYRENGIGELVVSRKHVERVLGGDASGVHYSGDPSASLPNFSAIGG